MKVMKMFAAKPSHNIKIKVKAWTPVIQALTSSETDIKPLF